MITLAKSPFGKHKNAMHEWHSFIGQCITNHFMVWWFFTSNLSSFYAYPGFSGSIFFASSGDVCAILIDEIIIYNSFSVGFVKFGEIVTTGTFTIFLLDSFQSKKFSLAFIHSISAVKVT